MSRNAPLLKIFILNIFITLIFSSLAFAIDATVTLNFKNRANGTFTIPAGESGYAYCRKSNGSYYSSSFTVNEGETSVAVDVEAGTTSDFICGVNSQATSTFSTFTNGTVSVSPSSTPSVNVVLDYTDATINFNLRDQDGNAITTGGSNTYPNCQAYSSNNYGDQFHPLTLSGNSSSYSLNVFSGVQYKCSAPSITGNTQGTIALITPVSGAQSRDVTYYENDASLTINFKDQNNNAITFDSNWGITCASSQVSVIETLSMGNSSIVLNLPGSSSYNCSFPSKMGYRSPGTGGSGSVTIELSASENKVYNAVYEHSDSAIQVDFKDTNNNAVTSSNTGSVSCSEVGNNSYYFYTTFTSGVTSATLPLIGGKNYSCTVSSSDGFPNHRMISSTFTQLVAPSTTEVKKFPIARARLSNSN